MEDIFRAQKYDEGIAAALQLHGDVFGPLHHLPDTILLEHQTRQKNDRIVIPVPHENLQIEVFTTDGVIGRGPKVPAIIVTNSDCRWEYVVHNYSHNGAAPDIISARVNNHLKPDERLEAELSDAYFRISRHKRDGVEEHIEHAVTSYHQPFPKQYSRMDMGNNLSPENYCYESFSLSFNNRQQLHSQVTAAYQHHLLEPNGTKFIDDHYFFNGYEVTLSQLHSYQPLVHQPENAPIHQPSLAASFREVYGIEFPVDSLQDAFNQIRDLSPDVFSPKEVEMICEKAATVNRIIEHSLSHSR
jgi:hypothetical protein